MSEGPALRGVVISHSVVAQALVTAAGSITGIEDALVAVSNEGCDPAALRERIAAAAGAGPAVLFIDLPGGSCLTTALRFARGNAQLPVVAGVNLAMLLEFLFHRDLPPAEAARRAADAGGRAIQVRVA